MVRVEGSSGGQTRSQVIAERRRGVVEDLGLDRRYGLRMEVPAGLKDNYTRTAVKYLDMLVCYSVVIVDCVTFYQQCQAISCGDHGTLPFCLVSARTR